VRRAALDERGMAARRADRQVTTSHVIRYLGRAPRLSFTMSPIACLMDSRVYSKIVV
jgi:hypothetical protein